MNNRPTGRKINISGEGKGIRRRGSGLGTGPVGRPGLFAGRNSARGASSSYGTTRSSGGGRGLLAVIVGIVILLLGGGGFGLSSLLGGGGGTSYNPDTGWGFETSSNTSSGWTRQSNVGKIDTTVADGARAKFTKPVGNGRDTVTVMVYMCGTDLESKSGMASADISEMTKATLSDKVNVLLYTGGCRSWKNEVISSSQNQIYKVESGGVRCLVKNGGSAPMTTPSTLSDFIKYSSENYPASRNILILWDHGAGSVTGFGYDEKNASAGAMSLASVARALSDGGVKFDAVGFDACLMATYETALTIEPFADYLIASEETEPGIGWYYTNWLTHLSKNSSLPTVELGREIADDFVKTCRERCPGQSATLSVVDLAELSATTPKLFGDFASEAANLCNSDEYKTVSDARAGSRSYAVSSKKDMVDLAHFCTKIGTEKSTALADAVIGAVKYNTVSSNMSNSYGLSIYFPYQRVAGVDGAVKAYEAIGLDEEYAKCIRSFATLEVAGQAAGGGSSSSPLSSIFGSFTGQSPLSSSGVSDIFSSLLSGGTANVSGLSGLTSFFGRDIDVDRATGYVASHQFDSSKLVWTDTGTRYVMTLDEEQWSMVQKLELNVFYDDGEGYLDFGFDNVFEFTKDGDLIGEFNGTWLAIDAQPVPYYHEDTATVSGETITTGYVPVLLNGERAELLIVFNDANPNGAVTGARKVYTEGETETVAKTFSELTTGDRIEFVCDGYTYSGEYEDSFVIGELTYSGNLTVSNVYIDETRATATYLFTDMYGQYHWSEAIPANY